MIYQMSEGQRLEDTSINQVVRGVYSLYGETRLFSIFLSLHIFLDLYRVQTGDTRHLILLRGCAR